MLPANINDSVSPTSNLIYWSNVSGAQGYEIRYREVGTSMLTYLTINDNNQFLMGLNSGTCYEYSIRTICDSVNNDYSPWLIPARTFCTLSRPARPNVAATDALHAVAKELPIRYNVFPNPTTGAVNIQFERTLATTYTVRVFNLLGAEVTPRALKRGQETCTFNLSHLTNGLYMIEISTAKQRWTRQVQVYK